MRAEHDADPVKLGSYAYDAVEGDSLQFFPVDKSVPQQAFQMVELEVKSNHGHPEYTCLYRFRVHGKKAN